MSTGRIVSTSSRKVLRPVLSAVPLIGPTDDSGARELAARLVERRAGEDAARLKRMLGIES